MRKPSKVTICAINWKIKWKKGVELDGETVKGYCDTESQTIYVDTTHPIETQRHILLHEILHAVWYSGHVNPHLFDFEEDVVSTMTPALLEALSQPQISRFLCGTGSATR